MAGTNKIIYFAAITPLPQSITPDQRIQQDTDTFVSLSLSIGLLDARFYLSFAIIL